MEIKNKTVVINGASMGLGKELAIHLASKEANVILLARSEQLLKEVQAEIEKLTGRSPLVIKCDISDELEVNKATSIIRDRFKTIDILVNNAGFGVYLKMERLSNQLMREHFGVNFFGAYYCIKAMLPLMKQSDSGYILNIGLLFCRVALAGNSIYAATKFALDGFSAGLRQELKPYGIKVGLFMPGAIDTPFQEKRDDDLPWIPQKFMLDPKKAARILEKMILTNKKSLIKPLWMLFLLKFKQAFG